MNNSKASQDFDIYTKLIKQRIDIITDVLHFTFNSPLENPILPSILKTTDVISAFKNDNNADENNKSTDSILSIFSNLFERCISKSLRIFKKIFLVNTNMDLEKVTVHSIALFFKNEKRF